MKIVLYPREKAIINEAEIVLGSDQATVDSALGKGEQYDNKVYYYDNSLSVEFDDNNRVSFIEVLGGEDCSLSPVIYGISAFEEEADKVFDILKEQNAGSVIDEENGYSYQFSNISVGVYRETTPESVAEMIEEMKEDGVPIEGNENLEKDIRRSKHWETIGIAVEGYWEDISQFHHG